MAKYRRDRTKLLDWIETNREIKEQSEAENFMTTDYAFKLYNQAHPGRQTKPPKETQFSEFCRPSEMQE